MYWNEHTYIPTQTKALFEQIEQDVNRPIRFLAGRGRTVVPGAWTSTQRARGLGSPSPAEAEANGITVVIQGSFNDLRAHRTIEALYQKPDYWNHDAGYANGATIYDCTSPVDPLIIGEPFLLEGALWAEVGDRQVAFHAPLTEWLPYLNPDRTFFEPIRMCLDEEAVAAYRAAQAERNFAAYCELMKRGTNEGVTAVERKIEQIMARESTATATLAKAKTQLRGYQAQLAVIRDATNEDQLQATREESWAKLQEHPKIEAINLAGEQILIDTVELTITHPITGETVPLGKFRWTICPNTVSIKAQNLTNRHGNYDHPHILNNRPCFGSMGGAIFELLARGDLAAVVEMMLVFLGTINLDDDWSRRATFWFDPKMQERAAADPDRELVAA